MIRLKAKQGAVGNGRFRHHVERVARAVEHEEGAELDVTIAPDESFSAIVVGSSQVLVTVPDNATLTIVRGVRAALRAAGIVATPRLLAKLDRLERARDELEFPAPATRVERSPKKRAGRKGRSGPGAPRLGDHRP